MKYCSILHGRVYLMCEFQGGGGGVGVSINVGQPIYGMIACKNVIWERFTMTTVLFYRDSSTEP